MRVLLAGGGSAGHIEPALATADALRRIDPRTEVTALGSGRGLETRLVPARGYPLRLIPTVRMPRRPGPALLRLPDRLATAVRAAGRVLDELRPDVVVGFGGYVALPAYLAARRRGVPLVVHEANVRAGLANRVGARFATTVAVASPDCRLPGARYVGLPLRAAVAGLDRQERRAAARSALGLSGSPPTLLVFGGSQGARRLNAALTDGLSALLAAGVQVLHITGPALDGAAPRPGYHTMRYLDRMELGYAAADLALCRAGAMTCAELAAVGLPAVYVPLPVGNGEQRLNAAPVVRAGGGLLVDDAELDGEWLGRQLPVLLADRHRLAEMGAAAAGLGRRDADQRLAELVRAAAGTGRPR